MEVRNPSFLPFCRHLEVEFSIPQKPVYFWGEGNLREKREVPTCCAAWLSFPTKRHANNNFQLSKLIHQDSWYVD